MKNYEDIMKKFKKNIEQKVQGILIAAVKRLLANYGSFRELLDCH